ncbi:MAG: hypothetical protein IH989_00440 [Planctomycetes bacterium]|nr:hypothetical protein [Planctomycetota bacterium]
MFRSFVHRTVVVVLVSIHLGCSGMRSGAAIQLDRMADTRESYGDAFRYMVDNAILSDMSLADIHFVTHTSELSGVGAARLQRMARLLNTYGGKIRYETALSDKAMLAERMTHVREFLALSGCELDPVEIAVMAPGGRRMSGQEAVGKYQRAVTVSDDLSTSGN